jgi:lipoprotein-releasing system ATP-binding protein
MARIAPEPVTKPPTKMPVILQAFGVRKKFMMGDSQIEVLHRVDLEVRTGEFIAIEGRSGSGKSTLLHILGALDQFDGGTVNFDGISIESMSADDRAHLRNKHFGFVFQFYHLLPEFNVLENTMLSPMLEYSWLQFGAKKREIKEAATGILKLMGLEHRMKHKPQQLSGGERQRVAISRALMNRPRILFADEPTGNLDFDTGRQIMAVLEGLHRNMNQTIIMVTHDRSLARQADRVLVLKDGSLQKAEG